MRDVDIALAQMRRIDNGAFCEPCARPEYLSMPGYSFRPLAKPNVLAQQKVLFREKDAMVQIFVIQ
jgi:hypothetical protein